MDRNPPNDRMDNRPRIRDTAGQDQVLGQPARRLPRRWPWIAVGGVAVLSAIAWVAIGWSGGGRSYDASRIRIAEVRRGDLVRDLSAEGRLIAANSPTLYAIAAGTVSLKIVAGDKVTKGQPLAVMEAMKMEHTIAAPADGTVAELLFAPGDQLTEGAELLRLESAA